MINRRISLRLGQCPLWQCDGGALSRLKYVWPFHRDMLICKCKGVVKCSVWLISSCCPSHADREHDQDAASKKRKGRVRGGVKRKTRAMLEVERRGPQTFAALLEEANLDQLPAHVPSYLTAAVGPPVGQATRKWCSVCGFPASYCCVRCGSRFCTRRCNSVHVETRCLKLVG